MAMAKRRDRSDQLRQLAEVIFRLMREYELATTSRLKVGGPVGRILKHLPEWRAQRKGNEEGGRKAKEPSYFTMLEAANELKVPICAFSPTIEHQPITDPQRKVLTLFARWTLANFARRPEERAAYTSDFEDFEAYVTIRKQADRLAASQIGTDTQIEREEVEVLESIRGIGTDRLQVTYVRGNSMAERLHDGDRVLVDVHERTPQNGDIVAVDRGHLGRTIGYWRHAGKRYLLEKESEPTIDLGSADDFTILGTVKGIVWAPLAPRRQSR